ncbi:hypothetical protein [Luteolibacter sp. AS25]|uniref:hypothetical protein n=1 Tax=Luteolibacter sp. AS25 TaxID=3135776 RepID=UPI00398B44D3
MRGFPILNLLIVVAFFGLAWWPLQKVTGNERKEAGPKSGGALVARPKGESFTLRIMSSTPLESLSISNLDLPIVEVTAADGLDGLEFEYDLGEIENPPEGLEFWVEASFLPGNSGERRPAISLELAPEDMELDSKTVTLWGAPGESNIGAPVLFLWEEGTN